MRTSAFVAVTVLVFLAGCSGGTGTASRAETPERRSESAMQGAGAGTGGSSPWEYRTEIDKMTDRTIHFLSGVGKSDQESYEFTIKCDAAPQFLLEPLDETEIKFDTIVDPGLPARRVSMRIGSRLVTGIITDAEQVMMFTPTTPEIEFVSLTALLKLARAVAVTGAGNLSNTEKKQIVESGEHAFNGLAEILASDKLLVSGVHQDEVIEFPAPKGDPNAVRFLSSCKANLYKAFGIDPLHSQSPQGGIVTEAGVASGPAPVANAMVESAISGAVHARRFTMRVAPDSLTPSESGDGFSFTLADGRELYVTANSDSATPGADILARAEGTDDLVCVTELDGQVMKAEAGTCP